MQDLDFGSVDGSLIEESQKFLMRSCMRLFKGKRTSKPDVMLELGDDRLPAHRALLAESSDYFKAMFEVSFPPRECCCTVYHGVQSF